MILILIFTANPNDGLKYLAATNEYELANSGDLLEAKIPNYWTHIVIASVLGDAKLYIDGRESANPVSLGAQDLNFTTDSSVLLDEVRIYDVSLTDARDKGTLLGDPTSIYLAINIMLLRWGVPTFCLSVRNRSFGEMVKFQNFPHILTPLMDLAKTWRFLL